jgi:hypothetical protein
VLAGSRHDADFVRNAKKQPAVTVRIAKTIVAGRARIVTDAREDALARRLLLEKYAPPRYEGDLEEWGREALPVAFDLTAKT